MRYYKKPLQVEVDGRPGQTQKALFSAKKVEVDVTTLVIHDQKMYGQIRKYQQNLVEEVKRSLMANPPQEPVTVTAW